MYVRMNKHKKMIKTKTRERRRRWISNHIHPHSLLANTPPRYHSRMPRRVSSSSSRHSSSSSSSAHSYAPLGGGGHSTATSSARPTSSDRSGLHSQHRGHRGAREDLTGFAFSFQQGLVSGAGGTTIGGAGVSVGAHSFTARSSNGGGSGGPVVAVDSLDFASDDDDDDNDGDLSDRYAGRVARRAGRSASCTKSRPKV